MVTCPTCGGRVSLPSTACPWCYGTVRTGAWVGQRVTRSATPDDLRRSLRNRDLPYFGGLLLLGAIACEVLPRQSLQPRKAKPEAAILSVVSAEPSDWSIPGRYQGTMVRKRIRNFPEKLLALTFDDGPDEVVTPRVLQALSDYNARATFFVRGDHAQLHSDLLRQAVAQGNVLGSHSYSHPAVASSARSKRELGATEEAVRETVGQAPRCFRPPYGLVHSNMARLALKGGYVVVTWTISSGDTRPISSEEVAGNVIHTPNPGDIVLLHDGPGHEATARAVPLVLNQLRAVGFRFVTVPELLRAWDQWLEVKERTARTARRGKSNIEDEKLRASPKRPHPPLPVGKPVAPSASRSGKHE